MQLETLAQVTHCDDRGYGDVCTHLSVTEMELCRERIQEEQAADHAAEVHAEGAWLRYAEGGWDTTGSYAAESLLTAGGAPALWDPQAA